MSDTVISVENLGKKYIIGHQTDPYKTLRDAIADTAYRLVKLSDKKMPTPVREEFWALKNISFEIKQGDRVGIIGRNGAGKSTLLKILSRITEPTEGRISIRGRVASLLEVGTGFHPELTGRENIYLNGVILGMSKAEIKRKFDEIVAFAEVEKFLDTPVKRYSSGMSVRLAFAIAAHLEPEILVVDEVLAVGDAQFQKKCLGKMDDISAKEGRTVLFVSHNMSAVEYLCTRGIFIDSGTLCLDSTSEKAVMCYLKKAYNLSQKVPLYERTDRKGSGRVKAYSFIILDEQGNEQQVLRSGKDYYFKVEYFSYAETTINDVVVSLDLIDERAITVLLFRSTFTNSNISIHSGKGYIICQIKNLPLANGLYRLLIFLSHGEVDILDWIEDAASITVDGGDFFGTGSPGLPESCKILASAEWFTI